jgi:RNA polymerase sigma factor (sigma-70 family)
VHDYLRACGVTALEAEDGAQQFFATLFARNPFERLTPEKGSFRAFLKTALRNFAIDSGRAAKVRSAVELVDGPELERRAGAEPPAAETAFDRAWAQTVLGEAIARLEREEKAAGRAQIWAIFEAYCLRDDEEVTYPDLARRLGIGEDAVRNGLRAARQRLRAILRDTIREYLGPHDDLEAELRFVQGR